MTVGLQDGTTVSWVSSHCAAIKDGIQLFNVSFRTIVRIIVILIIRQWSSSASRQKT